MLEAVADAEGEAGTEPDDTGALAGTAEQPAIAATVAAAARIRVV
ncbi:hypothetical protein [Pseudarthrobacter sp. DSP2-3-2b1]